MPVPKRKRSRARKSKRNANKGWKVTAATSCLNCQKPLATHSACQSCGYYKGRKVLETKEDRALKRGTQRKAKMARKQEIVQAQAAMQQQMAASQEKAEPKE